MSACRCFNCFRHRFRRPGRADRLLLVHRRHRPPSLPYADRADALKSKKRAQSRYSYLSLDEIWSTEACDYIHGSSGQRLCPEVSETAAFTPCLDTVEDVEAVPTLGCSVQPRSASYPLPDRPKDQNPPPRRWSATANLFFSKWEFCQKPRERGLNDQRTIPPSFRAVRF